MSEGYLNDGAAIGYTLEWGDLMDVASGGAFTTKDIYTGCIHVYCSIASDTTVDAGGEMYVYNGGTANNTTVNSGGFLLVSSGGTANSNTVNSSGNLYVYSGGTANSHTVNGWGILVVSNGGTANYITVNSIGNLHVSNGGTANYTTVNSRGFLLVSSGGTANSNTVNSSGNLKVYSGGTANSNTVNDWGILAVSNGGTANSNTMNSGGQLHVSNGGTANSNTVNSDSILAVFSGGTANQTTVNYSGFLLVSNGGTANSTTMDNGLMHIFSGGTANQTTVIKNSFEGGYMYVSDGGVANSTTLNMIGWLVVLSGGTANRTIVNDDSELHIYSGGTANTVSLHSSGSIHLYTGATVKGDFNVCGEVTVQSTGDVIHADGANINFMLSERSTYDDAIITDLGMITGATYFVTVSTAQTAGTYRLADGAANFNGTVTVKNESGIALGAVSVGGKLKNGDHTYSLSKVDNVLSLTISGNVPEPEPVKPTVTDLSASGAAAPGAEAAFTPKLSAAGLYTVNGTFKTAKGSVTVVDKTGKKVASGTVKNGVITFKNALLLDNSNTYRVVVKNTDKKGFSSAYSVELKAKELFTKGDNSDDTLKGAKTLAANSTANDWVGYGDAVDYYKLGVNAAGGIYDLSLSGVKNNVKLTVYTKNGTKVKTVTASAKKPSIPLADLCLDSGSYAVIEAPKAAKAQNSDYALKLTEKATFKRSNNDWSHAEALTADATFTGALTKAAGGDTVDYCDVSALGSLSFKTTAGKVKVSFYDTNKQAIKVAVKTGGKDKTAAAVSLTSGKVDNLTIGTLPGSVKYLKIEAAGKTLNSYTIGKIA